MQPSAEKAIPPASPRISLPVITISIAAPEVCSFSGKSPARAISAVQGLSR